MPLDVIQSVNRRWFKMGLIQVLWKTFLNWCEDTSIAGLSKGVSSKSNLKKAYWLCLFTIGAYCTIEGVVQTITDYKRYEVTTSNDLLFKSSVPFPAISICNQNRYITLIVYHWLSLIKFSLGYIVTICLRKEYL